MRVGPALPLGHADARAVRERDPRREVAPAHSGGDLIPVDLGLVDREVAELLGGACRRLRALLGRGGKRDGGRAADSEHTTVDGPHERDPQAHRRALRWRPPVDAEGAAPAKAGARHPAPAAGAAHLEHGPRARACLAWRMDHPARDRQLLTALGLARQRRADRGVARGIGARHDAERHEDGGEAAQLHATGHQPRLPDETTMVTAEPGASVFGPFGLSRRTRPRRTVRLRE